MNLTQLKYFTETVKHNSITKAAKELYVSQPAVSMAIRDLEEEFNTTFFTRNNNVLTLTDDGEYLYSLASQLLSHAARIKNEMAAYIRKKETLKIGFPPMLGSFLIPMILDALEHISPQVEVDVLEHGSFDNQRKVVENEIDLAVTVIIDNRIQHSLDYIKLGETELLFAINKNSPLSSKKAINIKDLKDVPLILMKEDTLQSKIIKQEFEKNNLNPNVKIRSNQIYTIAELIEQKNYGAFIFNQLFTQNDKIVLIPFEVPIKFDIILTWNKKTNLDKISSNLINYLKSNPLN